MPPFKLLADQNGPDADQTTGDCGRARAFVEGAESVYRFPSKGYGNVEGIAWLSDDTVVAVSDKKKKQQPVICATKDQSIHIFRIPAAGD